MNKRKQNPVTKKLDFLIIPHQILDENNWKTYVEYCCSDIPLNGYYDAIKDVSSELQSLLDRAKDFNELKNELNLFIDKRQKFTDAVSDSWYHERDSCTNGQEQLNETPESKKPISNNFHDQLYSSVLQILKI